MADTLLHEVMHQVGWEHSDDMVEALQTCGFSGSGAEAPLYPPWVTDQIIQDLNDEINAIDPFAEDD